MGKVTLLLGFLVAISGCSVIDSLTGVYHNDDGTISIDPKGGIVGKASSTANGFPGWVGLAGTLLGLAGTAYQRVRSKRYAEGLRSVVQGIDLALEKGTKIAVSKEELYHALQKKLSEVCQNPELVRELITKAKSDSRV